MIEINNLSKRRLDEKFIEKTVKKVLRGEKKKMDVSLAFVNEAEIKKLNRKYRKRDRATDVLSYIYMKGAGEVIISPQVVAKNAKVLGFGQKEEMSRVLIHGILHLFGYDHEKTEKEAKKMRTKEEFYLNSIF